MCCKETPFPISQVLPYTFRLPRARAAWAQNTPAPSLARGAETHTRQMSMGMDGHLPAVPSGGYLLVMCPVTRDGQEKEMEQRHKGTKIRARSQSCELYRGFRGLRGKTKGNQGSPGIPAAWEHWPGSTPRQFWWARKIYSRPGQVRASGPPTTVPRHNGSLL